MKLNNLDLNKLLIFHQVAKEQGISSAARKLALTPSAVSQAIGNLESSLNVVLFERKGRTISPTADGDELFEYLEEIIPSLTDRVMNLGNKQAVRGKVKLGVFYGCVDEIPSFLIRSVHQRFPEINICVHFGSPSDLDSQLSRGKIDFAINLFRSKTNDIDHHLLTTDQLWLLSARKPPTRSLGFDELRNAPFVDYFASNQLAVAWINHHFKKRIKKLPVKINAANSSLMVQLILNGVGIGVVASSIAKPYVQEGQLYLIRGKKGQLESSIWFKSRKDIEYTAAMNAFSDVVGGLSF